MTLLPIDGIKLGIAEAGIKTPNRKDLLVVELDEGVEVVGVFTQNRFCAAPVTLCQSHLAGEKPIRALVVNTGYANAGTGAQGLADAKETINAVAQHLEVVPEQVLPFSTGVILEPLPVDKITAGIPIAIANLGPTNWADAAEAIMTTDIVPKSTTKKIEIAGKTVTITGISKGSGMIHPNMATMLAYIATDAVVSQSALKQIINTAVAQSFNSITVDGDTSTNDSFILMASNQAEHTEVVEGSAEFEVLQNAITAVAIELAQAIVKDGEGATKFITVQVEKGRDPVECRKVADAIARSPLVKTAFFASDPNLGRILAAIGYADIADLDVDAVQLFLGDVLVAENGGCAAGYVEAQGKAVMAESEILVRVVLNRGDAKATLWTCDFSYDYVKINADYRT